MQQVLKQVGQVAASEATVMITGESGTGKELVARCIHRHSHRSDAPFHAVNCAAIPENLIESEFLGMRKALLPELLKPRPDNLSSATAELFFLMKLEICSSPHRPKFYEQFRRVRYKEWEQPRSKKVDVRLLAATHKNLEAMVEDKSFREDLYYRLNVVRIKTPPFAKEWKILPELVDFMLQRLNQKKVQVQPKSPRKPWKYLGRYSWPGNVRELENVLHSASVISKGKRILSKDLPSTLISEIDKSSHAKSSTSNSEKKVDSNSEIKEENTGSK